MKKGNFLVTKKNGQQFVSEVKLEHNMPFDKSEGINWLTDMHNAQSVRYITRAEVAAITRAEDE